MKPHAHKKFKNKHKHNLPELSGLLSLSDCQVEKCSGDV